jgi:hypothetical protein
MGEANLIPLTQGKFAIVDTEDYSRVSANKWCFGRVRETENGYAHRAIRKNGKASTLSMQRFILGIDGGVIDHVNGNGLDNRRANLRVTDLKHNGRNRGPTSGRLLPKGVHLKKGKYRHRKYFACIRFEDRLQHLGYFSSPEQAKEAYDSASIRLFGEFSRERLGELLPT